MIIILLIQRDNSDTTISQMEIIRSDNLRRFYRATKYFKNNAKPKQNELGLVVGGIRSPTYTSTFSYASHESHKSNYMNTEHSP